MKLFKWVPSSLATWIYTVILKNKSIRILIQRLICIFIPEKIELKGISLSLNQTDAIVSGSLAMGFYEKSNIDLFCSMYGIGNEGNTFLDIGANIGLYSALAAKFVGSKGKVIAIEPDVVNCSYIKKTIDLNRFTNIDIFQVAAGDYDGEAKLYLNNLNKADHRLYDNKAERSFKSIDILKMDTIIAKYEKLKVDFVKIDTQGYEYKVLKGMNNIIKTNNDMKITMEFWPWGIFQAGDDPEELLNLIQGYGFKIRKIDEDAAKTYEVTDLKTLLNLDKERQHIDLYLEKYP